MKNQEEPRERKENKTVNNTIDEGLNLFVKTFNNVTELDKSNDGNMNNKE